MNDSETKELRPTVANRLIDRIEQFILRRGFFQDGQPILVAVSGGLDSIALLHILHELGPKHRWRLTVAHLNHHLRGRSSEADERSVRRVAKRLQLPIVVEGTDVRKYAARQKLSLEMAARKLRHDFLARAASRRDIPSVALAHHADDQLELFFLRLLRGSGGEGLAGMKWRSPSPSNRRIVLVRPLLDLPKAALLKFAADRKIRSREDASNECLDFQRNRIRHELLPLLRRHYQPSLDKTILRVMEIIGSESEFVAQMSSEWLEQELGPGWQQQLVAELPGAPASWPARSSPERQAGKDAGAPGRGRFTGTGQAGQLIKARHRSATPFEKLPIALQRRGIQLQLLALKVTASYELVESLRLTTERPVTVADQEGQISPKATLRVFRDRAGRVHRASAPATTFEVNSLALNLSHAIGKVSHDGLQIQWRLGQKRGRQIPKYRPGCEYFDAEKVGSRILLRHWQPGDRFQPIGMQKSLKLQDFFTNEKVPQPQRHRLLVATAESGEVFWVEGLRISERFKLTEQTGRSLQWCCKRV